MLDARFERQVALFGEAGQGRLGATRAVVVGAGGVGCFVAVQLALLGVGDITLVDEDQLETTNRNRHICARRTDPIPGSCKVDITARAIAEMDDALTVRPLPKSVITREGFDVLGRSDVVFGCVDLEGVRLVLTEFCSAYDKAYFDMATEVHAGSPLQFGGRVLAMVEGNGCLVCTGELDLQEAREDLETPDSRADRRAAYGVPDDVLGRTGPSVVTINGVVSSLAVGEFMKWRTGLGAPARLLRYNGVSGKVAASIDPPRPDCYYCRGIRGTGAAADVERYLAATRCA